MTIRAKLYAAIVLTVLGPVVTTAVALAGMAQMGDSFDEVRERGEHESLARELVPRHRRERLADGLRLWDGKLRQRFCARRTSCKRELDVAADTLTDPREQ